MVASDGSIFMIVLMFLAFIVLVLWIFLPFAIFGVKDKLDALIKSQNKTNELLIEAEWARVNREKVIKQKVRKGVDQVDSQDIWPIKDDVS